MQIIKLGISESFSVNKNINNDTYKNNHGKHTVKILLSIVGIMQVFSGSKIIN